MTTATMHWVPWAAWPGATTIGSTAELRLGDMDAPAEFVVIGSSLDGVCIVRTRRCS